MDFPSIIKQARKATGLSQEDFAHALNVSFATVNRWETGKAKPSRLAYKAFLDYCKKRRIEIETDSRRAQC
ncbi:MAG: helix-turn-helix domain-containing protein [Verrucomicrobiota bacterium]|jgi:DNA-binding transcriptional regulator YiaG|nr:helix-turn-helix domain-containing protein [Verrucomicrobiota bacterium]